MHSLRVCGGKLRQREVRVGVDDTSQHFTIDDVALAAAANQGRKISTLSCLANEPRDRRCPNAEHGREMIAATESAPMRINNSLAEIEGYSHLMRGSCLGHRRQPGDQTRGDQVRSELP